MSKLIVTAEVSVDGALGSDSMEFWQQVFPFHSADVTAYLNDLLFLPEALVLGRQTYQAFAGIWPTRQGPDADRINALPKYVASRTLSAPLAWNATLLGGEVVAAVRQLKQAPGQPLLQYGVGALTHTLLAAGLVDELRLLVYPFIWGGGPRLFEQMGVHPLALLETQKFTSGVVALHYQPVHKPA